jgi:hypothetical protein
MAPDITTTAIAASGEEFRDDVRRKLPPELIAALAREGMLERAEVRDLRETMGMIFADPRLVRTAA